ncbi:MAG: DUF3617 domain-containing protein, partial [Geminicoccaceae bacterium]
MKIVICRLSAIIPAVVMMALSSAAAGAEGLPITPGLWEFTTQNPILGTNDVKQECVRDDTFDAASMLGDSEGCEISNETVSDKTIDYDMTCTDPGAGGSVKGHFSFMVDGDQGSGNADMTMDMGGQTMTMS